VTTTNRLGQETSPYLRQHADNPVDWYPWGPEAFEAAKARDVPILLSVGYSACHWCHVMAHESFEDDEVAEVLNAGFVAVKVDREERPDVDAVYMEAVQRTNGNGGWPMTVLLLPDRRPFFAGTYFPRAQFLQLLRRVIEVWGDQRAALESDAQALARAIQRGADLPGVSALDHDHDHAHDHEHPGHHADLLSLAGEQILARLDPEWGGTGRAPKFPQPLTLELLLQGWWRALHPSTGQVGDHGRAAALMQGLRLTLDAMSSGGIYDHVGGGFARYSTDRRWLVPHFEKMLYDNALLLRLYSRAWQATGDERYRQVAEETAAYLLSPPLHLPEGAWASAEDADSEGVEGRFYVWSLDEVRAAGGDELAEWYGVSAEGNWGGTNILWRPGRAGLARPATIEAGRQALAERRAQRVRPGLDAKVLTEWNAMAIAALAEAGRVLGRPQWVEAASVAADFLLEALRRPDGRWLRTWREGRAQILAFAGDHAWLVEAFTRLAEATGQARWMAHGRDAADQLLDRFWDDGGAGLFTTAHDGEALVARMKDSYDGALPSANAAGALALLRLARLSGEARYREAAAAIVAAMGPALRSLPGAFSGAVLAADLLAQPGQEVVVTEPTGRPGPLLATVWASYRPDRVVAWGEPYPSPLWVGRELDGHAFVCADYACRLPTAEPTELARLLNQGPGSRPEPLA
jgi:uncharacterized protein YyaL (SSP411 family)